jgi:hypothetical protein
MLPRRRIVREACSSLARMGKMNPCESESKDLRQMLGDSGQKRRKNVVFSLCERCRSCPNSDGESRHARLRLCAIFDLLYNLCAAEIALKRPTRLSSRRVGSVSQFGGFPGSPTTTKGFRENLSTPLVGVCSRGVAKPYCDSV